MAAGEPLEVVAICDANRANLDAASELAPGARAFTSFTEMLEGVRPDAVAIATPPSLHREQALAAIAAGAHVLVEKPLALSLDDARPIVTAAERANRVISMGLQMRHEPATAYLRELLTARELGLVFHTRLWCGHIWRLPPSPHFLDQDLAGGGVVAATTVHALDAVLWMLGSPTVATVSASAVAKAPGLNRPPPPFDEWTDGARIVRDSSVEDFAYALVRFADGTTLSLESSWLLHPTNRPGGIQFLCAGGVAEYGPLAVRRDIDGAVVDATPWDVPNGAGGHYYLGVARDFVRSATAGRPAIVRPREMLQTQAVIDAIYASAAAGREVPVAPIDPT